MSRCGIVLHVTKRLPREQVIVEKGIPCTNIERTLLDLAGILTERRAAIALDDALRRGQWHWGVAAESKDLEQHNALCALGFRVLYVTWSDATRYPERTVGTIRRMLSSEAA